ncbi:hypothetical protein G7Y89_g10147 [Cudoniella acicularis]|uniref:Ankyrin n=1 Tax=Cudoniella acicularis TaxID=354080 RepID=A0A8H4VZ10_9HELO|nr:hypothetical protein G7Y89_g10147 [Cudoniella acicularis]
MDPKTSRTCLPSTILRLTPTDSALSKIRLGIRGKNLGLNTRGVASLERGMMKRPAKLAHGVSSAAQLAKYVYEALRPLVEPVSLESQVFAPLSKFAPASSGVMWPCAADVEDKWRLLLVFCTQPYLHRLRCAAVQGFYAPGACLLRSAVLIPSVGDGLCCEGSGTFMSLNNLSSPQGPRYHEIAHELHHAKAHFKVALEMALSGDPRRCRRIMHALQIETHLILSWASAFPRFVSRCYILTFPKLQSFSLYSVVTILYKEIASLFYYSFARGSSVPSLVITRILRQQNTGAIGCLFRLGWHQFDVVVVDLKMDGLLRGRGSLQGCAASQPLRLRDYKTQLSNLFPSDYGNEVLRYRPSNWLQARSRFDQFKACRGNRIEKSRKLQLRYRQRKQASNLRINPFTDKKVPDSPTCPWRSYICDFSKPLEGYEPYVSPQALILAKGNNDQQTSWSPSYGTPETLQHFSGSDSESTGTSEHGSLPSPLSANTEFSQDNNSRTPSRLTYDCRLLQMQPYISKPLPAIPSSAPESRDTVQSDVTKLYKPESVIRSWEVRIGGTAGRQVVEHINSVIRYSSSNSWRSSIISIASSCKSRGSSLRNRESGSEDGRNSTVSTDLPLSAKEQKSWDDLVDESNLTPSARSRPTYQEISLESRPCCQLVCQSIEHGCNKCGFSIVHSEARRWVELINDGTGSVIFPLYVPVTDRFGNTPLHFAAASNCVSTAALKEMIMSGAKPNCRNSSGETFMHVLNVPQLQLDDINYFIDLLRFLETHDFIFESRDYHGRTIAHKFFQGAKLWEINLRNLEEIFVRLRVDFKAVDNLGYDFGLKELVSSWESAGPDMDSINLPVIVKRHCDPRYKSVNFQTMLQSLGKRTKSWIGMVKIKALSNWVDIKGDTPLTALLKHWSDEKDEGRAVVRIIRELVQQGCEIHARDRRGYTALAIASQRGLRPAVTTLIELGARVNTRSYNGTSVYSQTWEGLHCAKKGDVQDQPETYEVARDRDVLTLYEQFVAPENKFKKQFRMRQPWRWRFPG